MNILGQMPSFALGYVLCLVWCLAVALASAHYVPTSVCVAVTTKTFLDTAKCFLGDKIAWVRTTAVDKWPMPKRESLRWFWHSKTSPLPHGFESQIWHSAPPHVALSEFTCSNCAFVFFLKMGMTIYIPTAIILHHMTVSFILSLLMGTVDVNFSLLQTSKHLKSHI